MITYQVEDWFDVLPSMEALWQAHYDEVAVNKDSLKLAPGYGEYALLANAGMLSVLTARCDGEIIGYHVTIIKPHLHYSHNLCGFVDMYFITPEHRKGMIGVNLFIEAEKTLKARGVTNIFSATKKHLDMGAIFEHLDYSETERLFTKVI